MDHVIFNLNDVVLCMTSFMSCVLAALYWKTQQTSRKSTLFLIGFLLSHALFAVHELTYYGEQVRYVILDVNPNLFFLGSVAYCIDGVLLYLFTHALIYKGFTFKRQHLWHLLPLIGYCIYLGFVYHSQSWADKTSIIRNWYLTETLHFVSVEFLIRLIRVVYVAYCLQLLANYTSEQMQRLADPAKVDITWLRTVIIGFIFVFSVEALMSGTNIVRLLRPAETGILSLIELEHLSFLGELTNYADFLLLLSLLVYSLARISSVEQVKELEGQDEQEELPEQDDELEGVGRIKRYMEEQKPYMNAEITLPQLADALELHPKVLSMTLNHHFQLNFYEFVNGYRIEEAKHLLATDETMSITDIYFSVGFNSKSVFYQFFKKIEKITPTAYRRKCRAAKTADAIATD
ncbi:transcriptional regulator [Neiella marina]|uniref:Transcriptional regulator n=1 Tax=Neiella marina TaxID=508461 RepID=A0A8J2U4Q9_9GAMM|nr:helix-turn-helix domain-containing protein [Neiella marina]GGA75512.1 transcriptional regulator [Neiella marina]